MGQTKTFLDLDAASRERIDPAESGPEHEIEECIDALEAGPTWKNGKRSKD